MRRFARVVLALGIVCGGMVAALGSGPAAAADVDRFAVTHTDDQGVLQADQALLQAMGKGDKAALDGLLDPEFTWIDSEGKSQTRAEVLQNLPRPANSDVAALERTYGQSAVVRANRGKVQVMRIWARRARGWQAVLYQEVTLSGPAQASAAAGRPGASDCENPCTTIPFQPDTKSEKEAIASWQGVMVAMANNDVEAYVPLIADEFTATDTHHDVAFNKADRIAQIQKQKQSGERSMPPAMLSARMFDFGETVMMIAREQRPNVKPYLNTRMWVKRDGRWQMLFSFNTRIQ